MPDRTGLQRTWRDRLADKEAVILDCDASLPRASAWETASLVIRGNRANIAMEVCQQVLELLEGPLGLAEAEARIRACDHALRRDLWARARDEIAEVMEGPE